VARLDGKTAFITGGSRGIGAAIVRGVLDAGGRAIVHYCERGDLAAELVADADDRAVALQADFTRSDEVSRIWKEALAWAGGIDVLVNNAGVYELAAIEFDDAEWEASWRRTLEINLIAPGFLSKKAVVHFRERGGGSIVNIGSRGSFRGDGPDYQHYAATKGGLVAMTRTIAKGYGADGVLAYHIAPGWVESDLTRNYIEEHGDAEILAQTPLREIAPAEEVSNLVVFLASGAARHMTGGTIDLNGASYTH
jgi:NAD(P)-dependent dehydrogenase (short-subunit alcohol dehydrogenase family)